MNSEKLINLSLAIILIGGSILGYFHFIDGVHINKVITYPDYVNPLALQVVGTVYNEDGSIKEYARYKKGESVKFKVAFCKNRAAKGSSQFTLSNQILVIYSSTPYQDSPVNCYPSVGKYLIANTPPLPADAKEGVHIFSGVTSQILPGNRERRLEFALEPFEVYE